MPGDDDGLVEGHEQGGRRPGIVLQNDNDNTRTATTVIVPTTSGNADDAQYLSNVFLPADDDSPLSNDSVALCSHIQVVDSQERILNEMGELSQSKLREIENAVQVTLGLL